MFALLAIVAACHSDKGNQPLDGDTGNSADSCTPAGVDADLDGYDAEPDGEDCDDTEPSVHPGADEQCGDGVDQDCDGFELGCTGSMPASGGGGYLKGAAGAKGVGYSITTLHGWTSSDPITAVGAPWWTTGGDGSYMGAVYVVPPNQYGHGEFIGDRAILTLHHEEDFNIVGVDVAAGDLDGDGIDDLIIGNSQSPYGEHRYGEIYILYGPVAQGGPVQRVADVTLTGSIEQLGIGQVLDRPGDMTGDGTPDLAIMWPDGCREGGNGGAYVVSGTRLDTRSLDDADPRFTAEAPCLSMDSAMAVADLDGDGIHDLALGARTGGSVVEEGTYSSDGNGPGHVYVVLGPISNGGSLADADGRIEGNEERVVMGTAVETAQDLDGDGLHELLVSAPWESQGAEYGGVAYVVPGPASLRYTTAAEVAAVSIVGDEDNLCLGWAVADGGDMDADGERELVVVGKAEGDDNGAYESQGRGYIFRGPIAGTLIPSDAVLRVAGSHAYDRFGYYGATGGSLLGEVDLNADGFDDWLAGAQLYSEDSIGAVYSFYGGTWD